MTVNAQMIINIWWLFPFLAKTIDSREDEWLQHALGLRFNSYKLARSTIDNSPERYVWISIIKTWHCVGHHLISLPLLTVCKREKCSSDGVSHRVIQYLDCTINALVQGLYLSPNVTKIAESHLNMAAARQQTVNESETFCQNFKNFYFLVSRPNSFCIVCVRLWLI